MNKHFIATFLAFNVMFSFNWTSYAMETIDRILVVVNDEIITESDLRKILAPVNARLRATMGGHELDQRLQEARSFYLKQMVDDRLIMSEARTMNIKVEESEVDEMVDEMRAKFPSQEAFEALMREQGVSFKELREKFKNDIIKKRMVDFKLKSRITVSPGDIRNFYEKRAEEFQEMKQVRARQILIRTGSTRDEDEASLIAEDLVSKINDGESMDDLAKEYSEGSDAQRGGDMGWVKQGQFMQRIDQAIFSLGVGEITSPIKTQLGFHIFRVEDTKEAEVMPFEDVRNKIESIIYRNRLKELHEEWILELRDKAYISYQG